MKLGLISGYWGAGPPSGAEEEIAEAERLGFDSMWTSEAYGSDAFTPLAWWGSRTSRLRLGTAIAQMSARTPAATAMAAITLDHLSGGRFILGLGVSGPQVVEGWYGQPFPKPLARTREFIAIVRAIVAREGPVSFEGEHYRLPFAGGAGLGKALKSTVHPIRDLPIFLAAEGPKNVALAAEIADGWLPFWFSPKSDGYYRAALAEGFGRPGARCAAKEFEVVCSVPVVIDDDVEHAADQVRPQLALYVGGMGARGANFHYDVIARLGYEAECARIQELYLAGDRAGAMAAVPTQLVEDVALIGPPAKIRDELPAWRDTLIDVMLIRGSPPVLRTMAELVLGNPH
ncbi:MAG: LLM class F420-dependent oxidoreductase [Chloroflexi bacterium]|nr:MAG: LLM class F420-dependent oxidoreductase [Chloroflexota bacterium]